MKSPLALVRAAPLTALERAKAEDMAAQAETLAYCAEAVERLRDISRLHFATVCVAHDAPITADRLSADIARMLASLKSPTGVIR